MKDIHIKIQELGELIKDQEAYRKLIELDKQMNEDDEVLKLVNDFSLAQSEYNSVLNHFDFESPEAKKSQKLLFAAKLRLDSHPLVQEYNECLKEVNEPLRYLEYNLIKKITKPVKFKD